VANQVILPHERNTQALLPHEHSVNQVILPHERNTQVSLPHELETLLPPVEPQPPSTAGAFREPITGVLPHERAQQSLSVGDPGFPQLPPLTSTQPFNREDFLKRQEERKALSESPAQVAISKSLEPTLGDAALKFGGDFIEGVGDTVSVLGAGIAEGTADLVKTGAGMIDLLSDVTSGAPLQRMMVEAEIADRARKQGRLLNDDEKEQVALLHEQSGVGAKSLAEELLAPSLRIAERVTNESKAPQLLKDFTKTVGHLAPAAPAIGAFVAKFGTHAGMALFSALPSLADRDLKGAVVGGLTGFGFGEVSQATKLIKPLFYKALAEGAGFATVGQGALLAQGMGLDGNQAINDALTGGLMSTHGSLRKAKGGLDFGGKVGDVNQLRETLSKIGEGIKKMDNAGFAGERKASFKGKKSIAEIEAERIGAKRSKTREPKDLPAETLEGLGVIAKRSYKKAVNFHDLQSAEIELELKRSKEFEPTNYEQAQLRRIADIQEAVQVDIANSTLRAGGAILSLQADGVTKGFARPLSVPRHGRRRGKPIYGKKTRNMDEVVNVALEIESVENLQLKRAELSKQRKTDKVRMIDEALLVVNPPTTGPNVAKYRAMNAAYQELKAKYFEIGERAVGAGVINGRLDDFARHLWEGQERVVLSKPRTHKTIVDGWIEGKELSVKIATQNFREYGNSMERAIANKQFFERANHLSHEALAGQNVPIFSSNPNEVRLRTTKGVSRRQHEALKANPLIKVEVTDQGSSKKVTAPLDLESATGKEFVKKLKEGVIERVEVKEGGGFREITRPGQISYVRKLEKPWVKIPQDVAVGILSKPGQPVEIGRPGQPGVAIYASEPIARHMSDVFSAAKRSGRAGKAGLAFDRFNNARKHMILFISLFHPRAIWSSWFFGVGRKPAGQKMPFSEAPVTAGLNAVEEAWPAVRLAVRQGLTMTLGSPEGISELKRPAKTKVGARLDGIRSPQENRLFNITQSGLKVNAAMIEMWHLLKKNPDMPATEAARLSASLINKDFGGLNYERLAISKNELKWLRRFLLAPDWTGSNLITVTKSMPGSAALGRRTRRAGKRQIFTAESTTEQKLFRKFWGRIMVKGLGYTAITSLILNGFSPEEVWKGWERDWKEGNLRILEADVTNIAKALGTHNGRRVHWKLMGHLLDPVHWATAPFSDLTGTAKAKGSVMFRYLFGLMSGTDWKGAGYNDYEEVFRSGKLTSFGAEKKLGLSQAPAYTLDQIVNSMPIFAQEALKTYTGDSTWTTAAARAAGIPVSERFKGSGKPRPKRSRRRKRPKRSGS